MTDTLRENDVDQLNSFLRGEISAVETYEQALEKTDNRLAKDILRENLASHNERVTALRAEITRLGGDAADSSGAWGTFAKAVEGGAKIFGESAAVSALESGEEHGLKDYTGDLEDLSPAARQLVATEFLPKQQQTCAAIKRLKAITD